MLTPKTRLKRPIPPSSGRFHHKKVDPRINWLYSQLSVKLSEMMLENCRTSAEAVLARFTR